MAFTENLDVFLADFGVTVTSGAVSGLGLLNMPGELVADGMIITTDYSLRCEASKFGTLAYGASITVDGTAYTICDNRLIEDNVFCTVDGTAYTIRDNRLIEDGVFCEITLQKT